MSLKRTVFFLLMMVLVGIVMELVSIAYYTVRQGGYASVPDLFAAQSNQFVLSLEKTEEECTYVDTLFPHPYLAHVHHDIPPCGSRGRLNSQGLFGDELPLERDPDHFTILLTGGSVAAQMGQTHQPRGTKYLEVALNEAYSSPSGSPFKVLNGGDGAWKYPNQLILFAMFARNLDGVVTLDGFNEHFVFNPGNRLRLEHPTSNFHIVNPFLRQGMDAMVGAWVANALKVRIQASPLVNRSHLAFLVYDLTRTAVTPLAADTDDARQQRLARMFALPGAWDDARTRQWNLQHYADYLRMMDAIGERLGVEAAHFIQPVPAVGKVLTPEEREAAGDLSYGESYADMTASLLALRDESMAIFSLLDLLDGVEETIYSDHVHMRPDGPGYHMMARRMAAELAGAWGLPPLPEDRRPRTVAPAGSTPLPWSAFQAVYGGRIRTLEAGLEVVALPQSGAYAARALVPEWSGGTGAVVVTARLRVRRGAIGVGVLAAGGERFLAERTVLHGEGDVEIVLKVPRVEEADSIIIRNGAADGIESAALLSWMTARPEAGSESA